MKIADIPRYQKDQKRFENAIKKLPDKKKQVYYTKVLENLKTLVTMIDSNHDSNSNQKIEPVQIRDRLEEVQVLRYQLEQMAKDL